MSALTRRGSTARWRRIRLHVLNRDRWRCQVPLAGGELCDSVAITAGHIVRRHDGGTDALTNLRAECEHHNYRDGALARTGHRADPVPHTRAKGWT